MAQEPPASPAPEAALPEEDQGPDDPGLGQDPGPEDPNNTRAPDPAPPQPDPGAPAKAAPANPDAPATDIQRPKLTHDSQPRYPPKAWQERREADVVVLLTVGMEGVVEAVELAVPAGHGFDEEALRAARDLRFTPARINGQPTPVQIRYTFRFRVPETATEAELKAAQCDQGCPTDERKPGRIRATVYERGRGKTLKGVEVYLIDEDRVVLTDEGGAFEVSGPPGAYAFIIRPPGFYPYDATEVMEKPGDEVDGKYYVRRHRRDRYSTIVWGSEGRAEVARTSLMDDEIRAIPGTMGDPVRVAMLLPGVASSVSGLGYPIVRGALPGDSMYEVDGIQIPMLYHLLFGTAVIHPRFVDEITFQPGGYSAEHGRFPGGRIAATTAKTGEDPLWVADLSIVQGSLFHSQRIGDRTEVVAAARYGTLGYIIEGLSANIIFRYWDYQARIGQRLGPGKLTLTVMGITDTVGEENLDTGAEEVLHVGFHTADLRYRQAMGSGWLTAGLQLGTEFFEPPVDEFDSEDMLQTKTELNKVRTYLELGYVFGQNLEVKAGTDLLYQDFGFDFAATDDSDLLDIFVFNADSGVTLGAFTAAEWEQGRLLVNPSVRVDHYRYQDGMRTLRETALDPRLAVSLRATDKILVKASSGLYSGPTRFSFVEPPIVFGPIPAFEGPGLSRGLNRSWQSQLGVETKLPQDFELHLTGFYNDNDIPIDFSLLNKAFVPDNSPCGGGTDEEFDFLNPLDISGRSYGAEILLRRRLGNAVFGWLSYAAARSERDVPGVGTIPFDFDQAHVLNAVLSWEVGRNWTLGGVFHFNTGRPWTPLIIDRCGDPGAPYYESRTGEVNASRFPNYWRIDVRIQKREVFDTWFFDFYIDLFNAAFQWETIDYTVDYNTGELVPETVPLFIPMIGIRGEF